MAVVLEDGVAGPMPGSIGRRLANRRGGRGPVLPRVLITDIDGFRRRVEHRIIRPGRQSIALAVSKPGEPGPGFADHGSEVRVGDHVHPGRRRVRPRA